MNSLINLKPLHFKILNKSLQNLKRTTLKCYTTQTAVKVQDDKGKIGQEILKAYERLTNISIKIRTKKPQKPPFIKNVFLGIYDTDILTYPQLEKDELEDLDKQVEPVENYFKEVTSQQKLLNLYTDFVENLKQLRVFALQAPQILDARELNVTESCRFNDVLASNTSAAPGLLSNDQLGIQALLKKGSEDQKKKYLPQLIAGDVLSAFCMSESDVADVTTLNTRAELTKDKKTWILNGEKAWVINGSIADLLLVVAHTECLNKVGIKETKFTAFLVEKSFGGITTNPCKPLGLQGTDIVNVKFSNTPVPVDNILGEVNEADSLIASLLTEFRLSTGPASSAVVRKLMNGLVNYATCTNSGTTSISQADYVRLAVAEITTSLYAMESATYLTAGLLDQYENQDCQVESAIVKVFSSEQTSASVLKCMELIGSATYMKDHWCNVLHRDGLSHLILNESSENLKITIALLGLQHAGLKLQDTIKIARNPLFHPAEIFKRMWTQRKQVADDPRLTLNLGDYVHPSAAITSQWLEYCVLRLQFATETLLARYGAEVISKHMELKRLAECAIDIYVMTACLGRASRSYCIGLQHADYEMLLANSFCFHAMERVRDKIKKIYDGPYSTNDENYRKIAKRVFKFGKYFPVHPLTRNF